MQVRVAWSDDTKQLNTPSISGVEPRMMLEHAVSSSQPLYLGSGVAPLVFVEVVPLVIINSSGQNPPPSLSAPLVKLLLRQMTLCSTIAEKESTHILWDDVQPTTDSSALKCGSLASQADHNDLEACWVCLQESRRKVPLFYLPSDDPTKVDACPCWIVGYAMQNALTAEKTGKAIVTDSTLVRILPVESAAFLSESSPLISNVPHLDPWKSVMTGASCQCPLSDELLEDILRNHDATTVQALTLRMSLLMAQPITVGTTADAFILKRKRLHRSRAIQTALHLYCSNGTPADFQTHLDAKTSGVPSSLQEGALILHSPNHGAGKTLLAQAIAQDKLKCKIIHIIQPGALLAQYGIHADAALESLLHSIVMSAACRRESSCIVLDHLDAMLPPKVSGRMSAGDAAVPVLNAIVSYLNSLIASLKRHHEFLFPTKNPLYNLAGTNGHVLTTNMCLVGIMTCNDDGGRSKSSESTHLLACIQAGQYRLPMLSAKTRLLAFQRAFERAGVSLSGEASNRLPILAASAVSARGRAFSDVARRLKQLGKEKKQVSLLDLKTALLILQQGSSSASKVEFTGSEPESADGAQLFESVGGNMNAKQAIEEALALDPKKRRILTTFGLSPPTGVLLYGPPGTGKTLLAKATSRLLKRQDRNLSSLGGSFVSVQASEIVRGEVGNSEKMLVAAFETARSNSPSVVFIDEFQALFTDRSGSGSGKLSSTLLQCMDDVCRWREADNEANSSPALGPNEEETVESSRVVVMGATNTPWMIDSAFLRSGRFDRVIHVGLPTLEERVSILRVHVQRMKLVSTERDYLERICKTLAEECDGFSGADLAALCRAAGVKCLLEGGEQIEDNHFYEARDGFTPSCGPEMVQRLANWRPY